ncbi:chlorophyll A-B binding protein [Aureococcus anophagefferens]|nr:chlorophyll A-B binding protein [Aureococcus anophagefferens]
MQKIVLALAARRLGVRRPATRLATKINTATIEPETPEEEVVAEVAAPPAPRAWAIEQDMRAGITGPFGFFDPLSLSAGKSEQRLKYFREAELKHARVAMLAAAGFLVAENFHPLFGGAIDAPHVAYQQTPLQTFWPVVVLYVGIVEIFSVFTFESPFEGNLWTLKSDRVPGDFEFDPAGLYPEDAAEQLDMQNKELNNGRLAMIAMAGMVARSPPAPRNPPV